MRRRHLSALLVVGALTCAGVLHAQAEGGAGGPAVLVRAHGDERAVNVGEELAALRSANAKLVGDVRRAPMDFATAIARVHERARAIGGPAALAPVLKALPRQDAGTLRLLAVRELMKGRTSGMLLLLLAAYDREPNSVDALADLAGGLAGMGWVNEALACLDELARRKAVLEPPLGIAGDSLLAYVRGYCLVRLGEVKAARPLLAGVVAREPLLAEAARLMAIVGETEEERRKNFLLGVWRHRSELMVCAGVDLDGAEPAALHEGEEVAIDVRSLIDLSKGKPGVLPAVPYANSVLQANTIEPELDRAAESANKKFWAIVNSRKKPAGFKNTDDAVIETWGSRMAQLVDSLDHRDRGLRDLERARMGLSREFGRAITAIEERHHDLGQKAALALQREFLAKKAPPPTPAQIGEVMRPHYEAALQEARPVAARMEAAERKLFAEWHRLATAIEAQIGDKAWHEYVRLTIESKRMDFHRRLLHIGRMQASVGTLPWLDKDAGETSLEPEPDNTPPCNADNSISLSTAGSVADHVLPFDVGVEVNCEGITAELDVETRVPGVTVSTEFGVGTQGDFTVFVGPKASANLGDKEIAALAGSAKGGLYVTGNRSGVKDAGLKYEIKAGAKLGGATAANKLDEAKISFMPAPVSGDNPAGPVGGKGP